MVASIINLPEKVLSKIYASLRSGCGQGPDGEDNRGCFIHHSYNYHVITLCYFQILPY